MIEKLFGSLRRLREFRDSGAAAVELAIIAPLLVVLLVGVADYGMLMNSSAALFAGTRGGGEVAKANPSVTGTQLAALGIFPSGATPSNPTLFCTCVDNTAVTCPGINGTNPCAAKTDTRILRYVNVSATEGITPFLGIGGLTFPTTLSSAVDARLQ